MSERRALKVWLSGEDFALVDGLAERAGVETGALCREAIMRGATQVAADASAGRVRLRRRSGSAEVEPARLDAVASEGERGKVSRPVVPASGAERADFFRAIASRRP